MSVSVLLTLVLECLEADRPELNSPKTVSRSASLQGRRGIHIEARSEWALESNSSGPAPASRGLAGGSILSKRTRSC